jgi:hypothetical protein
MMGDSDEQGVWLPGHGRSLTTVLSFNEYGQLSGLGTEYVGNEEAEEFSINGYVENGRKWEFVKEFSNQHRVIYKVLPQQAVLRFKREQGGSWL